MTFVYGDDADFETVKKKAEEWHAAMGAVPCLYFNKELVAFNTKVSERRGHMPTGTHD
jgi:hypothetical protein